MTGQELRQLAVLENDDVFAADWKPLTRKEIKLWARLKLRTMTAETVRLLANMDTPT